GLWRTTLVRLAAPEAPAMGVDVLGVGPDFFATMQIPLLAGRALSAADVAEASAAAAAVAGKSPPAAPAGIAAAVVNQAFARRYFPDSSPIGERVAHEGDDPGPTWQIVGIVGDAKYDQLRRDLSPAIYLPASGSGVTFEVRTEAEPALLVPAVRALVQRLDA